MSEWKTGKIARLKSGGFPMTVVDVVDGLVVCQWPDGNEFRTGRFAPEMLEELEKKPAEASGPFISILPPPPWWS